MDANMFDRRCLSKYMGALQVREGNVWFPSCFGLMGSKNFSLHIWTDAATELGHSPLLDAQLMRNERALLGSPMGVIRLWPVPLPGRAPIGKIWKRLGYKHQIHGAGKRDRGYVATNFNATPLIQYRSPVGLGPSLKICP